MSEPAALEAMNRWAGQPLAVSATAWQGGLLHVRLSGSEPAVAAAAKKIGGEAMQPALAKAHWRALREHTHGFFLGAEPLWRVAVPSTSISLGEGMLIEWSGALRWIRSGDASIRDRARVAGGHATLFRAADKSAGCFTPLEPVVLRLHRQLKAAFDPAGILNPGRMYAEF
jgi:glycolate oxidase FAD binding subunit